MGATVEELSAATMFRDDIMEQLPPGFRFHPTDEEVIVNYLMEKVSDRRFSPRAIGEVDLNKCEPWDLPSKAMMGEKEWYFYCHKDKKYPTGTRTNRATECGYWKATGKDKGIYKGEGRNLIGRKKTLVFYRGRAPKGRKTNWVMHEFRLDGESSHRFPKNERDKWVVCRVTVKSADPIRKRRISTSSSTEVFCPIDTPPLPPLTDSPYPNYPKTNDRSSSKLPAEDKWNIDFVDVFPTMAVENQLRRNPNNTVVNQELNPFTTNTYAPFSTTPSVVHTPSPVNTFYLHQNGSSTGLTGLNQQMSTLETTTSTLQQVSEQHKNQSLVSAYPATSCNDWGTGMSQQLVSWESCDDIDDLLPPLPLSPVNFDAFFNP